MLSPVMTSSGHTAPGYLAEELYKTRLCKSRKSWPQKLGAIQRLS